MLIQTNTKYITSSMQDSPKLTLTRGDLLEVLKTVLTLGINEQPVLKLEAFEDNAVKVFLNPGHGFLYNQVLILSGDNTSFISEGTEFRVKSVSQSEITLYPNKEILSTGIIPHEGLLLKVAPLGYTLAFEDRASGIACFKNKSIKSPAILKVIDALPPNGYNENWARYARVVAGQQIDLEGNFINNEKTPYSVDFPDIEITGNKVSGAGGVHGFLKWDYGLYQTTTYNWSEESGANGSYPTDWRIIGDDKTFYLMVRAMGKSYGQYNILSFGNYNSFDNTESGNIIISGSGRDISANRTSYGQSGIAWRIGFTKAHEYIGNYLFKSLLGTTQNHLSCTFLGLHHSRGDDRFWPSKGGINGVSPISGKFMTTPLYIRDSNGDMRGTLRGMEQFYGVGDLSDDLLINEGTSIVLNTKRYNRDSDDNIGIPYLFSLLDWEEV